MYLHDSLAAREGALWLSIKVNELFSIFVSSSLTAVQEATCYGN